MQIRKKLTSVLLAFCLILSVAAVGVVPAAAETETGQTREIIAQDTVQGSAILHCFCWSYDTIKENLPEIAAAGYTAVQTSPVQPPKDYSPSWTDTSEQWWKLYQPLDLAMTNGTEYISWLGTKAQFTQMCSEADKYGIKVIVDIVSNHLANNGTTDGSYVSLHSDVNSDFKNQDLFYVKSDGSSYGSNSDSSRFQMTHGHLGMPELNTSKAYIQNKVLDLMKECVDCGADGFRFDTAKHIELPTDDDGTKSDFWPTVINGINNYQAQKGGEPLYIYGEILGDAYSKDINRQYVQYMDLTDDYTSYLVRNAVRNNDANALHSNYYQKEISADQAVLWAESHDTYMNDDGNSKNDSLDTIVKTWAMINSRADSTSLFFVRPGSMGTAGSDTTWKSTPVVESNKFKNIFEGQGEYLSYNSSYNAAYNERGTKGMVIVKTDGAGSVSLNVNKLEDGTYLDHVTNTNFTVSNGVITGTVGSSGVAVIYNEGDTEEPHITASTLYLKPERSSWSHGNERYAMYVFNNSSNAWVSMTNSDSDGIYEAAVPSGTWKGVIFCRMNGSASENSWSNKWDQTVDLLPTGDNDLFTITDDDEKSGDNYTGTWSVFSGTEPETQEPETQEPETVEPTTEAEKDTYTVYAYGKNVGWSSMNVYYWGSSSGEVNWPGISMKNGSTVFSAEIPKDVTGVIFNNGSSQTVDITENISDNAQWAIKSQTTNGRNNVEKGPTFYLVGTMNNWSQNDQYALSLISTSASDKVEYKLSEVALSKNAELKINDNQGKWYPSGNNFTVDTDGIYDVYFRPNADGNNDWYGKYFYLTNVTPINITWNNYDGTALLNDTVTYGTTPEYTGETPVKEADAQYTYTFKGWPPEVGPATYDVTYTAQFEAVPKTYTVTWKNYDGTELEKDENVAYGETP